jgi:glycosidase
MTTWTPQRRTAGPRTRPLSGALLALALAPLAAAAGPSQPPPDGAGDDLLLHVPSPDWRDQVIYFLMIDRFDDGDPGNNDQGAGEYQPSDRRRYSGGDLAGVARRLDYIRGLGASALWITPPVAHQWWDGQVGYGGYHGYWGADFKAVDPHFGTLRDYQLLSHQLHTRGMYLVQDIVVNHVGNFFSYAEAPDPARPGIGWRRNPDSRPMAAPAPPLQRNDPRRRRDRVAGLYHWTPAIDDFTDPVQERTWQLAELDDLATGNPQVRRALRDSYGHWIAAVGVDAFRVDTAFYVEPEFFADFLHADDDRAPGVLAVARRTGREAFHVFGEGFAIDRPGADSQARRIESWSTAADGTPLLPAMLNFPLYGSLLDVFARGQPTAVLGHRIASMMAVHARPHLMPSFVDNHDVDRFLATGTPAGLQQALLALMTLPGIPVIYYGTEQELREPRAAMFAGGHGGRAGRFDPQAPMYRYLQRVTALRRELPVLSRGRPTVLAVSRAGPGALAWRMDGEGPGAVVALNTAGHRSLLHVPATGLAPGTVLHGAFAIRGEAASARVGAGGDLLLALPPHQGQVWRVGAAHERPGPPPAAQLQLEPLRRDPANGGLLATGRAPGLQRLQVLVDGNLDRAVDVPVDGDGRWRARLATDDLVDPGIEHTVQAWSASAATASAGQRFRVRPNWRPLLALDDPAGDDAGRDGRYRYPTDPGWNSRPLDLLGARLYGSGGSLRIDVRMQALSRGWNPANGFDRVAFAIHIELPGRGGGVAEMPLQQARLPDGMRWHYRLRAGGWSNALFAAQGAGADHEGTPVSGAAAIRVDPETATVSFVLPAAALGRPDGLAGMRVHISTWDWDGGWRALAPEAGSHRFGGGGPGDPLVMDELLLTVPLQ